MNNRRFLWTLLPCALVLSLAAGLRGAEYDEQYTLFLTSGVPRPDWPETEFPAGLAREIQSGHSGLADIARDLRLTDVHPPLYFWLVSLWRELLGQGLFVARLLSVVLGLGALALIGAIARLARLPPVWAMLLTMGCYGFTYTSVVARGFVLAQLLLLGGVVCLLLGRHAWRFALAGTLFGAATMTNYLSAFAAGACLLAVGWEALWPGSWSPENATDAGDGQEPARPPNSEGPRSRLICGHVWAPVVPFVFAVIAAMAGRAKSAASLPGASTGQQCEGRISRLSGPSPRQALTAAFGFLVFIPADLWWFLAQRSSRMGQFAPFWLTESLARLAKRFAGDILGGLPLYVGGAATVIVAGALGSLLLGLLATIAWRWRLIGIRRARVMFALAALASPIGLLALGAVFDNTPIEVRYLTFSTPFVGLLLAGALSIRGVTLLLAVQAVSIAGLMVAPQTMQPAGAAAHAAAAQVEDGIVLLPRGNDGVGVVGAFAIEAPPALPLLLIRATETPEQIRARISGWHRVVLALLEQDAASRAASAAMRRALMIPAWREVARGPDIAVYERIGGVE